MSDNLEKYFKKHLSDETPGDEGWNVPSDDVWNKVEPELGKGRGLFIPWNYIYIIGALLIVGLVFILWPEAPSGSSVGEEEVAGLFEEPGRTSDVDMIAIDETNTTDIPEDMEQQEHIDIIDLEENIIPSEPDVVSNNPGNNTTAESIPGSSQNEQESEANRRDIDGSKETDDQLLQVDELITVEYFVELIQGPEDDGINPQIVNGLDPITLNEIDVYLEIEPFELLPTNMYSIANDFEPGSIAPINNKGKFGIGAFYAPTWNNTYVLGDLNAGELETGNDYLYNGNWGVELKYFLSDRFTLVTGFERFEIKSWSRSLIDFEYDTSTEHEMPSGDKENTSPVPMSTPFGDINTEITYRLPGDMVLPDGEAMYSAMDTHQEIKYWAIPIGLEYNILRYPKISWFAEGGLRYHRAIKDATEFSSRIIHKGEDMDIVGEVMTSYPEFTKNYLGFYAGTGVSYQLSKTFLISGSARYFGNITKVNLQDNMSTYVHGFNLKLGFLYIF